jgi:hypothetical protein
MLCCAAFPKRKTCQNKIFIKNNKL